MMRVRASHPRSVCARSQVTDGTGRTRVSFRRERVSTNWGEVQSNEPESKDRLHNLGSSQNYNINVDHGQSSLYIDTLFTGNFLGKKSDISDGSLRYDEFRKYKNIQGDYFIADRFLWKVAMHMTKNYLCHLMPGIKVPLVLGIWGPKGTGKTFQTELCFKKMGIEPIIMSAGELESDVAGQPGRLIRNRYRRAAEVSKVNGRMSALMINDIDAGLGRFGDTQVTVNNQIVVGSLMNICDNPTQVSIGDAWRDDEVLQRIPIIVTGNDFSTLFAPLIRDGRMDKFYWEPEFDEKVQIVHQLYKEDNIPVQDIARVIERFHYQPLDFFGALRSTMYDNQIMEWIRHDVMKDQALDEESNLKELGRRLIKKENLPTFTAVEVTYETLCKEGERLEYEQQMVMDSKLSEDYFKNLDKGPPPSGAVFTSFGG